MMPQQQATLEKQQAIEKLRGQIRQTETCRRNDDGTVISSGCDAIDAMLPAGGYNRGTIIEWFASGGSCAELLSLQAAHHAADDGGALVIIDPQAHFYPPAARAIGINLANLIVLQNNTNDHRCSNDFLGSIDQSLRCSAVAAVWGQLPPFATPQLATHWQRRFQLSAEASGCCGMFIHPANNTTQRSSSWAEIQWHLQPQTNRTGTGDARYVRAKLARCRGGTVGRTIDLEINTVTGKTQRAAREYTTRQTATTHPLPLANQLAHPTTRRRTARA